MGCCTYTIPVPSNVATSCGLLQYHHPHQTASPTPTTLASFKASVSCLFKITDLLSTPNVHKYCFYVAVVKDSSPMLMDGALLNSNELAEGAP